MELKKNNIDKAKEYLHQKLLEFDDEILRIILNEKSAAIAVEDEKLANACWLLEHIFIVKNNYIKAYSNILSSNYKTAWNQLEQIEIILKDIYTNSSSAFFDEYGLNLIRNNVQSFQKLFPYLFFISREAVIVEETCSICGKKLSLRNRCFHEIGKLYMGQLCYRKVQKIDLKAFAIVKEPMDKICVLEPEGKQFNYGMLEELKKNITGPYEKITVEKEIIKKPEYHNIGRNEACPCGSGKKYKKCCQGTDNEKLEHRIIIFSHKIKNSPMKILSTYKN